MGPEREDNKEYWILAINVGSTSTKMAVFRGGECVLKKSVTYTAEQLSRYVEAIEQVDMRIAGIESALAEAGIDGGVFDMVVARGGRLPPHNTGAYAINEAMLAHLRGTANALHPASSGAFIADHFARRAGCGAIIYDGPRSDELTPEAHVTGLPGITRVTGVHVLNGRACGMRYAEERNCRFEDLDLIVIHLGGGISITAFHKGRMVDALNDMESALAPERVGPVPSELLLNYYVENGLSRTEMVKIIRGKGGMVALLGTNDVREVERRIENGDARAELIYNAMCYQSAKGIGAMAAALRFSVDAVIITGSIARSEKAVTAIRSYVERLAPVVVYPGEFEMEALGAGALRVLRGEEAIQDFPPRQDEQQR